MKKVDSLLIATEILVTLILLVGGALTGEKLTMLVAPQNSSLQLLGLAMLPVALVLGLQIWLGIAFARSIWKGATRKANQPFRWGRPKGVAIMLPITLLITGASGAIVGAVSAQSIIYVVNLYLGLGLIYGSLCWLLGHFGYFDFWKWIGGE